MITPNDVMIKEMWGWYTKQSSERITLIVPRTGTI